METILTVFTPTYNRADKLSMVFTSLLCQTCKEFEWLIIDDGSTDNTKEVVDGYIKTADFSIRYYWKPNGGRHTAVNYSYQYLKTKYVVTCDSDDELLPDAVEKIINLWKKIERLEEYDRIWCITGREIDSETREIVGIPFPLDMNELPRKKKRITELRCTGEKHCSRKVAVHKMYKFPEPKDTKFITENTVWEKINKEYEQYFTNEPFGVYYQNNSDSLTVGKKKLTIDRFTSTYYCSVFYVNEMAHEIFINKSARVSFVNISRSAILISKKYSQVMRDINGIIRKIAVTLLYPVSWGWIFLKREKALIHLSDE